MTLAAKANMNPTLTEIQVGLIERSRSAGNLLRSAAFQCTLSDGMRPA
jgi:hypothetical protein